MSPFPDTLLQRPHQLINGQWVAGAGAARHTIVNPYTEAPLGWAALGNAADVDSAVAAARAAWPAWAAMPRQLRAQWLGKLAGALKGRIETIGALESAEMGSPISFSLLAQAQLPVMVMGSYAEMLMQPEAVERIGNSRVVGGARGSGLGGLGGGAPAALRLLRRLEPSRRGRGGGGGSGRAAAARPISARHGR